MTRDRERDRAQSMNYIYQTFPLHQGNELLLQLSSTSHQQQHAIQQDMLLVPPSLACNDLPIKLDKSGWHKLTATPDNKNGSCNDNNNNKKIIHRDVERKRRQEMATNYASLRSLLPLEYLKGKRSTSDHLKEGANYIRNLQKKIQELSDKRAGLKELTNSSVPVVATGGSSLSSPPDLVTVRPCWGGVEVAISHGLKDGVLPLSRVLQVLVHEGFNVVSCVSTKVNERSIHTIQSEISDLTCVDLPGLQQKLTDLIGSSS